MSVAALTVVFNPQPLIYEAVEPTSIKRMAVEAIATHLFTPLTYIKEEVKELDAQEEIEAKIAYYADKWGQSYEEMYKVVGCETGWTFDPKIQSFATYKEDRPDWGVKKGDQELSFGLAQIHAPVHDISYEQMTDPDFALNFMGEQWSKGNESWWTCHTDLIAQK